MSITYFVNENDFLSNFYGGRESVEHQYQAGKTANLDWQRRILQSERPADARYLGHHLLPKELIRPEWPRIRVPFMTHLVREKFSYLRHHDLAEMLLATEKQWLVEGNFRHDNFWGACQCQDCHLKILPENQLGKILMQVRDELRVQALAYSWEKKDEKVQGNS